MLVVSVEHRSPRPLHQRSFRGQVAGHVAVEVQVLGAEIGPHRQLEGDLVEPPQGQPVGARLEHDMLDTSVREAGEQRLHLGRFGAGEVPLERQLLVAQADAGGPNEPGLVLPREQVMEQERGRGLAVGAGDADHPHAFRRVAVEGGCELGDGAAGIVDVEVGHPGDGGRSGAFADHRDRAARHRVGHEGVSVDEQAGPGHEQGAGGDLVAVLGDPRHHHLGQLGGLAQRLGDQLAQGHVTSGGVRPRRSSMSSRRARSGSRFTKSRSSVGTTTSAESL